MKKKRIIVTLTFVIILFIIVILVVGIIRGNNLKNKLIGSSWVDEEYDLWKNEVYSDKHIDSYKVHFISKDEIQIWHEAIVSNNVPGPDQFKHTGGIVSVRKKYSVICIGNTATVKITDSDSGFFKTLKINFDNDYNIKSVTTNDFSSSKYNVIKFKQLASNETNEILREGNFFIDAPNLIMPSSIDFENSTFNVKQDKIKKNDNVKIYFFGIGNEKKEADKIYKEYQEIIKEESGYEFKITGDDMIYVYDKDELVSIITAGYDDEIGYFIAISFLDI